MRALFISFCGRLLIEILQKLFSSNGFVPRAQCGLWTPDLIRLHNVSDFLIWAAYLAIPAVLMKFAYSRRRELPFRQLFWLFGLFIFACGTTHLLDIVMFYNPLYRLSGAVKLITAAASWGTVFALFYVTPQLLKMRTAEDFELEIEQRKHIETELQNTRDVLEIRVAERTAEHEKSAAELRASEASFRTLTQAMPQIVWTALPDGYLDYYNQRWVDYTGMTVEETQGWGWAPVIHPEDLQNCIDTWTHSVQTGEAYKVEYRFLRASDKTYRWHLGRALPLHDEEGRIVKWFGTCTDIQDQKQAEAQLREARDTLEVAVNERTSQLEQANGDLQRELIERSRIEVELKFAKEAAEAASLAKSQFLANMSHEIRTPMNGVLGPIGLLSDSRLTKSQRELTEVARSSAESLLGIINDVLDLSKIEAGRLDIEPIPFNLLLAVEETASMLAARADEKTLDLVVRYPPEVPRHVVGDAGRIRQILSNLIGNAVKFTSQGHVFINVEVVPSEVVEAVADEAVADEAVADDGAVTLRISVEDSGIGIASDQIEQVFGRFNQADTSTTRRYGGTGLGLAISKQLVELMGGEIGATSTRGEGSTFWFTLRLPQHDAEDEKNELDGDLSNVRVLGVDDNAINRRVLNEQLLNWKIRNEVCASADEALALLRKAYNEGDPFHLAILDHQMPDRDGEELGTTIKSDPHLRNTVLVMLTSIGHTGDATRLMEAGFAAYLLKPARQSELLSTLSNVWAAREAKTARDFAPALSSSLVQTPFTTSQKQRWKGARTLVVEDNIVNQKVATLILTSLGCNVEIAKNGVEALRMVEELAFDIVFMDCEMPEMDGYQATAAIRARTDQKRSVPIVAVTAKATRGDRERCLEAGMDDYLSKPVRAENFEESLRNWIPDKENEADNAHAPESSSESATAAIDPAVINNLRSLSQATDPQLMQQIFGAFLNDGDERMATLQRALAENNAETLRQAAHILKGASANIGARRMADIAHQLQRLGEQAQGEQAQGETIASTSTRSSTRWNAAASLVEKIQEEFARVKAEIVAESEKTP